MSHNHFITDRKSRRSTGMGVVVSLVAVFGLLATMAAPAEATRRVRRVAANFTMKISPDNRRVSAGQRAVYPVTLIATGGFRAVPDFDIDGVPDYIDAEISKVGTNRYQLALIVPSNAPTSNTVYKLYATSGKIQRVALFRLQVNGVAPATTLPPPPPPPPPTLPPVTQPPTTSAPQFNISVDGTERTARTDETVQYAYSIDRSFYSGPVSFTLSNAPTGLRAGFSQNPSLSNTSVLLVTPASNTPSGRYVMTIVASAGSTQRVSAVVLNVKAAADFAFVVSPSSVTLNKVGRAQYRIDIGAASTRPIVTFEATGMPPGSKSSFSSASTDKTTTLRVDTSSTTPNGTYLITITGRSGSYVRQSNVTLVVNANPGFGISADRSFVGVTRGVQNLFVVSVKPFGGFSGPVALTTSGLPAGVTVTSGGSSGLNTTLVISADPVIAKVGNYRFTVVGTSGIYTASIVLDLAIN